MVRRGDVRPSRAPRIGLISMGGTGFTTDVDDVRVSLLKHALRR